MARVDGLVDAGLASGLKVILNSHNFDPVNEDPAGAAPYLAGVWRQIAAHFAHRPNDRLWFEIENEPNKALKNDNLMATLGPSLAAIRATNPHRAVIIGGENWAGLTRWPR
jgi:endoglucanase